MLLKKEIDSFKPLTVIDGIIITLFNGLFFWTDESLILKNILNNTNPAERVLLGSILILGSQVRYAYVAVRRIKREAKKHELCEAILSLAVISEMGMNSFFLWLGEYVNKCSAKTFRIRDIPCWMTYNENNSSGKGSKPQLLRLPSDTALLFLCLHAVSRT